MMAENILICFATITVTICGNPLFFDRPATFRCACLFWWLISLPLIVESRPHNAYIPTSILMVETLFSMLKSLLLMLKSLLCGLNLYCLWWDPYFWWLKSVVLHGFGFFKVGQRQLQHPTPHGQVARVARQLQEAEFQGAEKEFLRLARRGARKSVFSGCWFGCHQFYFPYIGNNVYTHVSPKHHCISWLVAGLVAIFGIFPYIGNVIIPIDELIFFRGVAQPPTSFCWIVYH